MPASFRTDYMNIDSSCGLVVARRPFDTVWHANGNICDLAALIVETRETQTVIFF